MENFDQEELAKGTSTELDDAEHADVKPPGIPFTFTSTQGLLEEQDI